MWLAITDLMLFCNLLTHFATAPEQAYKTYGLATKPIFICQDSEPETLD